MHSRAWRVEPAPNRTADDWVELFEQLQGAPETVVGDEDNAMQNAVARAFPDAYYRLCEYHLAENARKALPDRIANDKDHGVLRALRHAFFSQRQFEAFIDAVAAESEAGDTGLIERWVASHKERLLLQTATRRDATPNSNGPVEQLLRSLSQRIEDRAGRFTNRARLRKLLALMTMEYARRADVHGWTRIIQTALEAGGGRAPRQRPHDDADRTMSLFPGSLRPARAKPGRGRGRPSSHSGRTLVFPDPDN